MSEKININLPAIESIAFSLSRKTNEKRQLQVKVQFYVPTLEKMLEKININLPANRPKHSRAK